MISKYPRSDHYSPNWSEKKNTFVLTIFITGALCLAPARPLEGGGDTWVRLGQSSTLSSQLEAVPIKVNLHNIKIEHFKCKRYVYKYIQEGQTILMFNYCDFSLRGLLVFLEGLRPSARVGHLFFSKECNILAFFSILF